jgi:hypothetical protein
MPHHPVEAVQGAGPGAGDVGQLPPLDLAGDP